MATTELTRSQAEALLLIFGFICCEYFVSDFRALYSCVINVCKTTFPPLRTNIACCQTGIAFTSTSWHEAREGNPCVSVFNFTYVNYCLIVDSNEISIFLKQWARHVMTLTADYPGCRRAEGDVQNILCGAFTELHKLLYGFVTQLAFTLRNSL